MRTPLRPPPGIDEDAIGADWECLDILLGGREVRRLTAGVFDEDAEHVFTKGHCHSFAEAVRRLRGDAVLVFAFDREGSGGEVAPGHVLIQIGGRYLDAHGWIDEQLTATDADRAFEREWDEVVVIGPRGWLHEPGGWLPLRVEDAIPFAAALLERLGLEAGDIVGESA